jgi:hypothetical protein
VPLGNPPGELLAVLHDEATRVSYAIARDRSCTRIRYAGLCEFVGDAEMQSVAVYKEPGADDRLLSVVGAGALLAIHLMLRGELILHASAIRLGDAAIAFVGASGMGKSTLATLLAADGCQLVSDDVLRVALPEASPASVYPGSVESRLRPGATALVRASRTPVRRTGDGRTAVRLSAYRGPPLPLAACVVPLPDHEATEIEVTSLSRAHGLKRLLQFPRIVGWVEQTWLVQNFHALAGLVARVPVLEARVPWGPPFTDGMAGQLTSAVLRQRSALPRMFGSSSIAPDQPTATLATAHVRCDGNGRSVAVHVEGKGAR